MPVKIPFLVIGDGPQEPTGLGRIARDLCAGMVQTFGDQIDLVQVGGQIPPAWRVWAHLPMGEAERGEDWGASYVEAIYRDRFGDQPGILWLIWDPSRLYPYTTIKLPVSKWAYTAVDADNIRGTLGGPAAVAVQSFDRICAYGRWASRILKPLRGEGAVPYLPHGLTLEPFAREASVEEQAWVRATFGPRLKTGHRIIGCVATNQARKDLGLYCQTLRTLLDRGHKVFGWLHTDVLVKAWAIPQLVDDFGLANHLSVSTEVLDDRSLALFYRACSVTVAPGLGEGFGYPIVESLAAGVPVVHGDTAGGRELVPKREWRFPVRAVRLEGVYASKRPVFNAEDVANAIERVWGWQATMGQSTSAAYCRGSVAHLDWANLWGYWRSWIKQGLEA